MVGFSEGVGTFISAFSFWAAVAMLGLSGVLALSKPRRAGLAVSGLIFALLIASAPSIMASASDVASGAAGGPVSDTPRPSVMEYFATLSVGWRWMAGVAVAVWLAGVVATIAAALSRLGSASE